jgi:glycosyltransferase involved in cell wall biosynthesis
LSTPPRVSVITPSLNQGTFIERTIRSVLEQDYEHIEYIVVDGGSTDETLDVLRRYDDRITRWVSEPDEGQAHAIMKGISLSSGDAVAYINSDDFYLPGGISALAEGLADAEWSAGACRYEHADGTLERVWVPELPPPSRKRVIDETWYVPQASSLWRRSVFDRLGGLRQDLHYVFDSEFCARLALAGVQPALVDREIAVRYLHDDAKSAGPERFDAEWRQVQSELLQTLGVGDAVRDAVYRVRRKMPFT